MASTSAGTSVSSATSAKRVVVEKQDGQPQPGWHVLLTTPAHLGQLHPGAHTVDCPPAALELRTAMLELRVAIDVQISNVDRNARNI